MVPISGMLLTLMCLFDSFSSETVRAAKNLDGVIGTLVNNFGEGSDFFKILVGVFQSSLLTAENEHLKTFCMIGK